MDYIRRSIFRQPEHLQEDVEWQPQQLNAQPEMEQNSRYPTTRQRFSSLFTRSNNNDQAENTGLPNKYALASNFGESTENLAAGPISPATHRGRFSLGIPSLQLPKNIGLVGHSRFSEQSSAPRPLYTTRGVVGGARAPSSVYPPTECKASDFVPPLVMPPMPIYTYNAGTTATQIEANGSAEGGQQARTQRKLDRQHRHHPRHQHRRKKHGSKHGRSSKHRHQQSARHHDLQAPSAVPGTESALSSSTDATGTTSSSSYAGEKQQPARHHRHARSPPRPFMGCFPPVRSRRMRARIVQCIVAGLFVVLMGATFAGLTLSNTVDPSQFTIPMAIILAITALIMLYTITRLCMLVSHKRRKAKDRARRRGDVEAQQQQKYPQQQQQSAFAQERGFAIPQKPIPVVLTRDEQAAGLDSGVSRVEPPAYGYWRESMRMDPNRVYWQRNEQSPKQHLQQQDGLPPQPDYANHPAMAATPVLTTNDHTRAADFGHDNHNAYNSHQDDVVSDIGSSGMSGYSPNPSAVSSPSEVHANVTLLQPTTYMPSSHINNNGGGAVPATPMTVWPRPPSYMSDAGAAHAINTPRHNQQSPGRSLTTHRNSLGLMPPNPPPTLMQLPSDFSLFTTSQQRHQEEHDGGDDEERHVETAAATKFQPAYYIPDPRDTRAYQAQQQQDYYIDLAASSAVASRAQSPVHHHHQHTYTNNSNNNSNIARARYVPPVAESECGTIAVGITASQYDGGGAGTRCNSTVFGLGRGVVDGHSNANNANNMNGRQQACYDDEIVYDDEHAGDGVGIDIRLNTEEEEVEGHEGGEVAYIDVEVFSSDDEEEERPTSKGKNSTSRSRSRKAGKGSKAKKQKKKNVDGTPLIGQLGGAHGWS
ncbi:hypothetical protein Micbo1qcDRAFT_230398 [Microdochium bolleyi]|uniref:Uncharacterized protein n=1 Tax=Microdochium bolleyi TaxID=196109 RepID=A0A136JD36_9PEZI|nr:hypothetical protein Micbo1qcDRAFT_230398 [Microdochium bolleyi]